MTLCMGKGVAGQEFGCMFIGTIVLRICSSGKNKDNKYDACFFCRVCVV